MIGRQNSVSVTSVQKGKDAVLSRRHSGVGAARRPCQFALFVLRFRFSAWGGVRARLWLKQRGIFAVAFFLQFFSRHKTQRGRVYAESLTGRRWAVVE